MAGNTTNKDHDVNGFSQSLSTEFTRDMADKFVVGDVALDIGQSFLEGAAMNSSITLEQEMSLKAMKALIDKMADESARAQATVIEAQSAPQQNIFQDIQGSQELLA